MLIILPEGQIQTSPTLEHQYYLAAVEKIVQLFAVTASTQVLKFIMEICCREKLHPSLGKVNEAFSSTYNNKVLGGHS